MKTEGVLSYGYGKRLDVDLSTGLIIQRDISPWFAREFVGGMGFSSKILYDEVGADVDPLSPDNLVVIGVGTLTGTNAPCAARVEITTKHPLTGNIGTGNTGGRWGTALKRAGFDIIVIRNKAEKPVFLWIDEGQCEIRDAGHLWGTDTYVTSRLIEQELSPSAPSGVKVLAIGLAGENLVRYACAINEYYHCAGRNGAGAVMGAKKLKAIAVRGNADINVARPEEFQRAVREARQRLSERDQIFSEWGQQPNITKDLLDRGCLPGNNFQTVVIPNWINTRSVDIQRRYITEDLGSCHACPILCFKGAEVKEGKYAGVKVSRGDHPGLIIDFGAKCAINNIPAIWKCKQLCHELGMDYATVAGVTSFAMELFQRGIITNKDTNGLDFSWGNEDAVIQMLPKIARREGFGDLLAEGSTRMAETIGRGAGKYVMATKGMEMMSQDPRTGWRGWAFGELTNPRGGDNVKNTHFFADQYQCPDWWVDKFDMFEDVKKKVYCVAPGEIGITWEGKPMMCKWFEELYTINNALGICFFPSGMKMALGPTYYSKLFSAFTSWDTTPQDMMKFGEKIFTVLKAFNTRQGLTRKDDVWPDRFYTESIPEGPTKGAVLSREEMGRLLDEYYDLRGWDKTTGLPTKDKLIELGLGDIAEDLSKLGKLSGKKNHFPDDIGKPEG